MLKPPADMERVYSKIDEVIYSAGRTSVRSISRPTYPCPPLTKFFFTPPRFFVTYYLLQELHSDAP